MADPTCPRAGRWIGGCRFEARMDEVLSGYDGEKFQYSGTNLKDALKALLFRTSYIRDVCIRCGKTIERVPT